MTHLGMRVAALIGVLLMAVTPLSAQTILNNTTLAAAVPDGAQSYVVVTSASTLAVGHVIFVPGMSNYLTGRGTFEGMLVTGINGTRIAVQRGAYGWAGAHRSGVTILTGAVTRFKNGPPETGGYCRRSDIAFLPWVDLSSGNTWTCPYQGDQTNVGTWAGSNASTFSYGSGPALTHRTIPAEAISILAQISRGDWFRW